MRIFPILLIIVFCIPIIAAHVTPTPSEQAIMDQVSAPTIGFTSCDQASTTLALTIGAKYLLVSGAGSNGSATSRFQVSADNDPPTLNQFIVHEDGMITNIAAGVTAHLLFHQNITVAGAGNAFWAWVEYVPTVTSVSLFGASTGGVDAQLLQPYTVTGLGGIVGNFSSRNIGGCPHPFILGRVFDGNFTFAEEPTAPQNFTATAGAFENNLNWAPPLSNGSAPLLGYNIYRQDSITMTPALLATINATSYKDEPLPCTGIGYNYSVTSFNSVGEGPATPWSGFIFPLCRTNTLFGGDDAQIYGPGGKTGLADALGISPTAAGFFWGFLILLGITITGYIVGSLAGFGIGGSLIGACIGLGLTTLWEMIPWWATLFIVAVSAAIYFLFFNKSTGEI